ncbi:class II aldolase/adducin family protein [Ottowia sp.]|uniref:class II aldolase/adducin family protein n=1 Tax=Ottowia sp. TaxID=1898956 RepID=UPI001E13BD04|nr:class II aldolase/adducin family protein [Ottowia sp.]MCP5258963.1 class II aldolase/adducin family protein [Burkholderiaceae bacterium]MCB2024985.1 class II aldolase/adducin family protein [Ottowia sp.]MCB2032631.1 class II aldolase/adducin family protein [Ottowia sp.]HPK31547.1 class II aldolase/adducin family protein [Ottowia sp.]HPR43867.1 class II aldolase/adducin family protein [Ottowia sp.]
MPVKAPAADLVDRLVLANRILYDQGVVDGLGHASVRHDSEPGVFLLSCNRAPGMVRRRDITCYDYDGNAVSPDAERPYLERFIHGEIYRARPDVVAVVHSHSPSVIPFAITRHRLRPVYHMAGFLGRGAAHFEIRDAGGDTDMLIRNPALGKALADSLGGCSCVLMRGHGSTVVGASLEQAVYRAIYAEMNARLQLAAQPLGEIEFLNEAEARLSSDMNDGQIPRSWNLWVQRLGTIDLDH